MKLAIMQPYFFPYLGYFQAIEAVDKYIIYSDLNYIYQGWVDRNRLIDKSGQVFYIRPQLENASVSKLISEIELSKKPFWKNKLIKTLTFSYAGAKHHKETLGLITDILQGTEEKLCEFNFNSTKNICSYLGIKTKLVHETTKYKDLEAQLRSPDAIQNHFPEYINNDIEIKVIRALKMCEAEDAKTFVNAIGGRELYSKEIFEQNKINLRFLETKSYDYKQFNESFTPHLSIIDVLMHNGKDRTRELINNYNLI